MTDTTIIPTDDRPDPSRPVSSFITWLVQYGNVGPARTLELDYLDDGAVLVARQPDGLRVEYATASTEAELLRFLFGQGQARHAPGYPPLPSVQVDSHSGEQPATPRTLPT